MRAALLSIAGAIVLAACQGPALAELPYPPQRVYQNVYSFLPPAEPGWRVLERRANRLAYVRPGTTADETFAITASVFRITGGASREDFLAAVGKGLAREAADPRYRVLAQDTVAESGAYTCTRSRFALEDHAAVKRTATPGVMVLELLTRICVHPKDASLGVRLEYSHRRYPEHADAQFAAKAERVVSSLEFLDP